MDLIDIIKICKRKLDVHFRDMHRFETEGRIAGQDDAINYSFYYPTTMICIKTENSFCIELAGISKTPRPLSIKKKEGLSLEKFLSLHDKDPLSDAKIYTYKDAALRKASWNGGLLKDFSGDVNDPLDRFPIIKMYGGKFTFPGRERTIDINDKFISFCFSDVCICSLVNDILRARNILLMFIFGLDISSEDLCDELDHYLETKRTNHAIGVIAVPSDKEKSFYESSNLLNMVLNEHINETWIGDYLNENKHILLKALGYEDVIYEPLFEWVEKSDDNDDVAINPDAMLLRKDGYYDICDLKKGLPHKVKITRGERKRRKFISDIYDGIAQLNNYEEYFSYEGNKIEAMRKYGVSVSEPMKILVVGNLENTDRLEVEQALRGMKNMSLVDYDSLINLYFKAIFEDATRQQSPSLDK
ncbi:hypothetical protein DMT39_08215 [Klebsiella variicola]|uniref:Shedu anti-phage system protein SduA domain-containing protein n=3 Tax=Klebsiella variicola TaxID=244366 RepID=UPI000D747428|nr:Shedu anti-phage system protein SduA domain-containing protein [Klebsiella variicola]PXM45281.1 hypothetical protein DMT39_08215 [Klebsiella variicola]